MKTLCAHFDFRNSGLQRHIKASKSMGSWNIKVRHHTPLAFTSRAPHPSTDHVGLTKIAKKSLLVPTAPFAPNCGLSADLFMNHDLFVGVDDDFKIFRFITIFFRVMVIVYGLFSCFPRDIWLIKYFLQCSYIAKANIRLYVKSVRYKTKHTIFNYHIGFDDLNVRWTPQ